MAEVDGPVEALAEQAETRSAAVRRMPPVRRERELRLVCTHPLTLRVLKVTGLARLLPPQPTLDAALERPEATSGSL